MSTFHTLLRLLLVSFGLYTVSVVNGFGMNLMKVAEEDRSQVLCTLGLLRKYFHSGETLSGSLVSVAVTSASVVVQQNLLRAIHLSEESWTLVVRNGQHELDGSEATTGLVMHEKPQSYFVVIENLEDDDLEFIFEDWKTTINWNPLAQFVVLLASVEESDEELTELMTEILLSFLNKKIYNVNVIGQNEENGFFYGKTVFPYHPDNNCGSRVISIETLDICEYQDGTSSATESGENDDYEENDYGGDNEDGASEDEEDEGGEIYDEAKNLPLKKMSSEYYVSQSDIRKQQNYRRERREDAIVRKSVKILSPDIKKAEMYYIEKDPIQMLYAEIEDKKKVDHNTNSRLGKLNYTESSWHRDRNAVLKAMKRTKRHDSFEKYSTEPEIKSIENVYDDEQEVTIPIENVTCGNTSKEIEDSNEAKEYVEENGCASAVPDSGTERIPVTNDTSQEAADAISNDSDEEMENESNDEGLLNEEGSQEVKVHMEELYRALFLDKFPQDLSGCPLVAAFRPWEPYIFNEATIETDTEQSNEFVQPTEGSSNDDDTSYDTDNSDTNYNTYDSGDSDGTETSGEDLKLSGIEYKMVQTIGEQLHINIEMQVENTNLYHLFQLLIDGDIEMIVGGIDEDPSISQYVSSTIPYHQDDLTWCVAKVKRKHSLFNFLETFKPGAWILTILYIFTTAFIVLLIERLMRVQLWYVKSFITMSLRIMGIVLSQSMRLRDVPLAMNITLAATFFMGLMFSNIYQSFLVSTLTTPRSSGQISHLVEIYDHRMSIMGSVDNVRHLNKDGKIFKYIRENFQMCYDIEACLQRAAHDEAIAVAVSRQHSFYNPRIPRDQLYCFGRDENLYIYLVTMLLPKKYHLLHKINPVIQYIIESGHMQKWARDLDMKRKIHDEIHRVHEDPFKPLTLAQVIGSFVFNGILLSVAIAVFLLERWSYWMVTQRRTRLKIPRRLHRRFNKY